MIEPNLYGIYGVIGWSMMWAITLAIIAIIERYYKEVRDDYLSPISGTEPPHIITEYVLSALALMTAVLISFGSLAFLLIAITEVFSYQI